MNSKKFVIGIGQFLLLMTAMVGLVCIVAPRHKDAESTPPSLLPGIHTREIPYYRVTIHESSPGALQFESEEHVLYVIAIIGPSPTALKPGQFTNLHLRQIFEVKGSADAKSELTSAYGTPCTPQTPCALFLQADLLQRTDQTTARNMLKMKDPSTPFGINWN